MAAYKLVLVRHGESEWTKNNLFCGWFDAKLSQKGKLALYGFVTTIICLLYGIYTIVEEQTKYSNLPVKSLQS